MLSSKRHLNVPSLHHLQIPVLKVAFTSNQKGELQYAVEYLLRKLNFNTAQLPDLESTNDDLPVLVRDLGGRMMYIHPILHSERLDSSFITFYTDNCLRDYHKFIQAGLEFSSRPDYCTEGLRAEFIAPNDSCYALLEKRTYSEFSFSD